MRTLTIPLTEPAYLQAYLREPDPKLTQKRFPAVIIVPGGGYTHIPKAQSETLALAFVARGFQAFFLRYHFNNENPPLLPQPIYDLGAAIRQLRQHAQKWYINPDQVAAAGFSVGGHIVSLYNGSWQRSWLQQNLHSDADTLKLNAAILSYPVIRLTAGWPTSKEKLASIAAQPDKFAADQFVNPQCAPTFIWHTADDNLVPVKNSLLYLAALNQFQVPFEAHIFHHGPHGLALANAQTAWKPDANQPHVAHWLDLATEWLQATL